MTLALIAVALLMLVGLLARMHVAIFRWLYIPASVIAGLLGLMLVQVARWSASAEESGIAKFAGEISSEWSSWPGWLIAVVFATLLLESRSGSAGSGLRRTASQVVMVWIIVVGQTAVGLTLTWLAIQPFYQVPNSFGMLIETGFAGGHGTAAAMGMVYSHPSIALESGLDLGILMATAGLVYGVVSGIIWINIAARLGWIPKNASLSNDSSSSPSKTVSSQAIPASQSSHTDSRASSPIGFEVISRELIDPLILQVMWVAAALAIGLLCQWLVGELATSIDLWRGVEAEALAAGADGELAKRMRMSAVLGSFPLFIYTLLGGWLVRLVLRTLGAEHLIDNGTILQLSAVAMDVLVVAAIGSLSLQAVASLLVPFLILLCGAMIWTGICLMVLSRMILPAQHWFQLGLINYGMSTGTTATGFVLLRIVDPELRTKAAEDYALAAPFSAPFIGGGMLTVALPLLVLENVPVWISAIVSIGLVALLIGLGTWLRTSE